MASTTVYPNGDGTNGGWTNQVPSSSNLWQSIDEGTDSPNDADYIQAVTNVVMAFLLGDMPGDFSAITGITIRLRLQRVTVKGADRQFSTCAIYQSNESSALTATCDLTGTTGTVTTFSFTPSITGATDKTTWDAARIKFNTPTGTTGSLFCYAMQVEIDYTTSSGGAAKHFIHRQFMA